MIFYVRVAVVFFCLGACVAAPARAAAEPPPEDFIPLTSPGGKATLKPLPSQLHFIPLKNKSHPIRFSRRSSTPATMVMPAVKVKPAAPLNREQANQMLSLFTAAD